MGFPITLLAKEQSFSDVPSGPVLEAVEFLKTEGMVSGYADGTFRPRDAVNRAEALKLIMGPLVKKDILSQLTTTSFDDVPKGQWYLPYVEAARQNGIVDGPPKRTSFLGSDPVRKMEFIKMLLLAYRIDPNAFSEIRLPLADDVTDPTTWYYPFLRYAFTTSMVSIGPDGMLNPSKELTRGDTALILSAFLRYRSGERTSTLLMEAQEEFSSTVEQLENNDLTQAEFASARALLAARGAHASRPNDPTTQGTLKMAESLRALIRGLRAGVKKDYPESIRLAGDAWNLAARARELNSDLALLSTIAQTKAKSLADEGRASFATPKP
jgi:hypothetical protein